MTTAADYAPDLYVSPRAAKLAERLADLVRDNMGTITYEYGYERIIITRDTDVGISIQFQSCNPKRQVRQ